MKKAFLAAAIAALVAVSAFAQHGGQRTQAGQQGGQGRGNQQSGMGQQSGAGQGQQTQTQQRSRIHATDQQRQQLKTCTQSAQQVRDRVRSMARLSNGYHIGSAEATQWREQLRSEIRAVNQTHEQFINGLSAEQQTQLRNRTKEMNQNKARLDQLSEDLDMALALEAPDMPKVRQTAREMEKVTTKLQEQQRKLGSDLGIDD